MREYVELREPGIDLQIAEDMVGVLVAEQGYKDDLKTLGLAVLMRCLAKLKVTSKAVLAKVEHDPVEEIWARYMIHPRALSFWINTLVPASGRERHVADMRDVRRMRLEGPELRLTALDL